MGVRNTGALRRSETGRTGPHNPHKEIAINRNITQTLSLAATFSMLSVPAVAQDNEDGIRAGKLAFNSSCRTCHSIREGDNRLGPNLNDIIGREAGSEEYGYSAAMAESTLVWDAEKLDRFIHDPQAVVPGNNMKPYGGISDAEIRANIVSYLESESGSEDDAGG